MVATVTSRPFVSMFASCAYCPASTLFRCLRCESPSCPAHGGDDLCPDCQPAPVAPLVALGGWSMAADHANEGDCAVRVACAGCGDRFWTEDPDDDTYCAACTLPAAEVAALRM